MLLGMRTSRVGGGVVVNVDGFIALEDGVFAIVLEDGTSFLTGEAAPKTVVGSMLLEDGASIMLLEDNSSELLGEG